VNRASYWSVIAIGSATFLGSGCSGNRGEVSIVNEASQAIRGGQLEICNQRFTFGPIEPKQTKTIQYRVKSDSHYNVGIEFASGKKLTREVGYVTSGANFHDTLTVKDDDVSYVTSPD